MHGMTALAIIALVAASLRCVLLATFTAEHFQNNSSNIDTPCNTLSSTFRSISSNTSSKTSSHVFDLIHSFFQIIHVVEYFALLYGIGGFYLYAWVKRDRYYKLNAIYKETSRRLICKCSFTCVGFVVLCGFGVVILAISAFVPVALLTVWQEDIITGSKTLVLTKMYVGISYFCDQPHLSLNY